MPIRRFSSEVEKLNLHLVGRALAFSTVIGVVAGTGAIAFNLLSQVSLHFFLDVLAGFRPAEPAGEAALFSPSTTPFRLWMLPLVPALGGLLAGLLIYRFAPEAAGHGTDAAINAFHRGGGFIRARVPLVKTIASAITLGSGGSGGREGPIAQIGAGFGSFLGTVMGLSDRDRRILLAAGVGAGVGSIFRAPLAGALFAAEILYSDPEFEPEVVIPAAMSSIIAYCVFSLHAGFGALFYTPEFRFNSALELIPYTVLAIVVALAAGLFVKVFYKVQSLFAKLDVPNPAKPMIGGFLAGLVAVGLYLLFRDFAALDVLAFGYGSIQSALTGELSIMLLLALAVGKIVTSSLSIGSGGSGGVFGPSMVVGGSIGGALGLMAQRLMPEIVTQPGAYVAVGMAGFFAAAANTPISTLVMVSEMTGNYHLLLPALWVCSLSYLIGRRWSLYRSQVRTRFDSPAHRGAIFVDILRDLSVRDVISERPLRTVAETASLSEVIQAFTGSTQHCFPVVDAGGLMTGVVYVDQIREILERDEHGSLMIAHDVAAPVKPVFANEDLNSALHRLVTLDVEELPVTLPEDPLRPIALLSRRDVMAVYSRMRLDRMAKAKHSGGTGL